MFVCRRTLWVQSRRFSFFYPNSDPYPHPDLQSYEEEVKHHLEYSLAYGLHTSIYYIVEVEKKFYNLVTRLPERVTTDWEGTSGRSNISDWEIRNVNLCYYEAE